jgi:5-methylcytosine-specific restriction endonuclease McrA
MSRDQRSADAARYRRLYKTARWQRIRAAQLAAHPLCRYCQEQGRVTAATVCDHAVPHKGNEAAFFDQSNLQSLCSSCHDSTKQSEEKTGKKKDVIGVDGWPVSVRR